MKFIVNVVLCSSAVLYLTACGTAPTQPTSLVYSAENNKSNDIVLSSLESAVSINSKDATSWALLARAYFDKGMYTKAIRAGNEAISLDENNKAAKEIVVVSSLRLAESKLKDIKKTNGVNSNLKNEIDKEISIINSDIQ